MFENRMRNFSIMKSMAAVTVIPMIVVVALSAWIIVPKLQKAQEYSSFDHLLILATDLSNLVHEQQKERGASAVYLGSQGQRFATELAAQRLETDGKRQVATANINAQLEWLGANGEQMLLVTELNEILSQLDNMATVRTGVDNLSILTGEAVAYYTKLNALILTFVKDISKQTLDGDMGSAVISFAGFLQGKERAGIERAVGAGAFAAGGFSAEALQRLQTLIQVQDVYYSVFMADASRGASQKFEETMNSPAAKSVQRMRDIALAAGIMGSLGGVTGEDFFQAQTQKINLLHDIETFVASELHQLMQDRLSAARFEVLLNAAVSLIAMSISLAAAWFVAGVVRKALVSVSNSASRMAEGDLESELPESSTNEIGAIVDALDSFRTSILKARDAEQDMREKERQVEEEKRAEEIRLQQEKEHMQAMEREAAEVQRAKEAAIAEEIASVVSACAEGDFSRRMDLGDKEGAFASICKGINSIGEVTQAGLDDISKAMNALSANDLTYRAAAGQKGVFGEIAGAVNASLSGLSSTLADIRASGVTVGQMAEQLSEDAVSLSSRTERTAATLEETSATMSELHASVGDAASAAESSRSVSRSATEEAESGLATVEETVTAMQAIKDSSNSITQIIDLIDNIAFQTNLLALNAGVEAARAGEAGRGFAVVATEVRDLAARSSDAAKQIAELISDTSSKIETGVKLVEKSGEALTSIASSISEVSSQVENVAVSAQEQSTSIQEVNTATTQLEQATQENAAMFEETTAAISTMKSEFEGLQRKVNAFKFDGGTSATTPSIGDWDNEFSQNDVKDRAVSA